MGLLEPITHKEEIEQLVNDAKEKYDNATRRLEEQKNRTSASLGKLGEQKLEAWSGDMEGFVRIFSLFNNVHMVEKKNNFYQFAGLNAHPQELMINMQRASLTAKEVLQTGALAIGTGALVGIASYGGAMMFGHASTGTAIAALSGAAKTNATLAWFGGGSLATGGLGKLGGKLVLSGVVIAPILIVAGVITAAKSKEKLAEAKKMHAEAENAVAQMNTVISGMKGIEEVSENYRRFLRKLSSLFKPFISEMERIAQDYLPGPDGKICYDMLSEVEQKTLHLSWLLAQLYYHGLSTTILTNDGNVAPEAKTVLTKAEKEFSSISGEVSNLNKEKEEIRQLLASAEALFDTAFKNYYDKKMSTKIGLIAYGKRKIELCTNNFKNYVECLSMVKKVRIEKALHYGPFNENTESVFDVIERVTSAASKWEMLGEDSVAVASIIEMAAYDGMAILEAASGQEMSSFLERVDKHDISRWLAGDLDPVADEQFVFSDISTAQIYWAEGFVSGITGKENLDQAKAIYTSISETAGKMNAAATAFESVLTLIDRGMEEFKKIDKLLKPFVSEIKGYGEKHSATKENPIELSKLTESEQRVIDMFGNLAKLQFHILGAHVLPKAAQDKLMDLGTVTSEVSKEIKLLYKESFKMDGAHIQAANLIWRPLAQKTKLINFAVMFLFSVLMVLQLTCANLFGLIGLAGVLISCPIFFYYKDLPQSKLFMWRIVRLVLAVCVVVGVEMIGLVG